MRLPPLRRPADDRLVLGVCAGFARGFGANVLLVRLVFVAILVITGGLGVIAYGALALLMPAEPGPIQPWSARSVPMLVLAVALGAAMYAFGLQVVTPPHFNVGVSLEPVYPGNYSCSILGYTVDGPSVQATPTQDELEAAHYLSFCPGPQGGGEPWVIGADTGIHPSPAGYRQMASQVPAPAPGG